MMLLSHTVLEQLAQERVGARGRDWLNGAVRRLREAEPRQALLDAYPAATRQLGRAPVVLSQSEASALAALDPELSLARWMVSDLGRAVLLLVADEVTSGWQSSEILSDAFHQGDTSEQQSWLRTLSLLSDPGRFTAIAVDACRTNILPLFEAIACDNPFPAREFPELSFNQLVLKALFNSIPLARIVGLDRRANAELARMATAYASERAAAGRAVPGDIELVMCDRQTRRELVP